jgi:hypothetical protein
MAKQEQLQPRALVIRKLADQSSGTREFRYDPNTGERHLYNPATGQPEPWPFAGIKLEEAPPCISISTGLIDRARAEGWVEVENERVVHRPGGPPNDQWRVTHTFRQYDILVFHTVDGDVRYRVTHQPDKYAVVREETVNEDKGYVRQIIDPEADVTPDIYAAGKTRVDWYYIALRED